VAGRRRADRERVGLPCSEYLWLRLLDQITDNQERELREREDRTEWNAWCERFGSAPFDYFLDGFKGLDTEVFDQAEAIYAVENPGKRPSWWWPMRAPEMRLRVGGKGTAPWDAGLADLPWFEYGIPGTFMTWWWSGWRPPPAGFTLYDAEDPPTFESSASYLWRNGLLLRDEARRLRPADFAPEAVR
jgi:hypothetical protein